METYGKILLIATPAFLLLVLFEKFYGVWKGKETYRNMDMISSLSSGITNATKDVLGLSVVVLSYGWLVNHLAIVHVQNSILTFVIAFVALDLAGYWVHRIDHEYNFFWNSHIIHHSSEDFNLACALRQSISSIVKIFAVFLLPAALLGVPEKVVIIVAPLHLFAQFWYHTQHIDKMGFLEKIIVTPSHHRVHHAINAEYLDKNYSQIFIIWDKLFGTFQEERKENPPVYGITRPVQTWNPIKINFQHLWLLIKDAWHTKSWEDKFKIWMMPTGWRPADVAARNPVYKIDDVYHYEKFDTKASPALHVWSWVQLLSALLFVSYLFGNIAGIHALNSTYIYIYGFFLYVTIYAYTELMSRNKYAAVWETVKNMLGIAIILQTGDWFGATELLAPIKFVLIAYFIISTFVTGWFVVKHAKEDNASLTFAKV
jgi:alkylglycerol monooxygenase